MLTGRQYKESLKDGRKVYFEGRVIEDLGSEPALAVPLQAIADGYDKYYSAEPGAVNPLTIAPRNPAELRDRIPVITEMDLLSPAAACSRRSWSPARTTTSSGPARWP
jgi:4-hydroxybutyryl-CoA dehydratase/vinylacetyl-CoA-Delta-isomerase